MGGGSFEPIHSSKSAPIIRLRNLISSASARRSERAFSVEGARSIADAARSGANLLELYVDAELLDADATRTGHRTAGRGDNSRTAVIHELLDTSRQGDVPIVVAHPGVLDRVLDSMSPQGIAAIFELPEVCESSLESVLSAQRGILALDRVQDPTNVGALIRVAAAAGYGAVVAGADGADPYGPKAARAAAGLFALLPVVRSDDLAHLLSDLTGTGTRYPLYVADTSGDDYRTAQLASGHVVVVGNEGNGPSAGILKMATSRIAIPLERGVESLNVATAAAVIAFESRSQRSPRPSAAF